MQGLKAAYLCVIIDRHVGWSNMIGPELNSALQYWKQQPAAPNQTDALVQLFKGMVVAGQGMCSEQDTYPGLWENVPAALDSVPMGAKYIRRRDGHFLTS
eukprot:GDKI01041439.1.p1 GENE.GDKI01041439.1~~GDKI01041439.1.p1  ORF type:complete len:100 (+),score=14.80 GDKI01041439.1:1-300(+)